MGTCIPVHGTPVGKRAACASGAAGQVCSAAQCDGIEANSCQGFTSSTVQCRAPSCTGGVATLAGKCTGGGRCADPITTPCTPYVCTGAACGTSCASDHDCDKQFQCASGKCVARDAASCDGMHTLVAPNGDDVDCSPYTCLGAVCKSSCTSVLDCVFPSQCSPAGQCVAAATGASSPPSGASGGCACDAVGATKTNGAHGAIALLGALAFVARHRRRRRGRAEM
jgi:hypothetical protein